MDQYQEKISNRKLNTEQKIDLMYIAIAGDKDMGLVGMHDRLVNVENAISDIHWLRWLKSTTVKVLAIIGLTALPILGTYIGNYIFRLNGGGN